MSDKASYTSKSTVKSLWQEYRVYADRLEFDSEGWVRRLLFTPDDLATFKNAADDALSRYRGRTAP